METEAEINFDDIPELTDDQLKVGVRGKYYKRAMARKALVRLDPDVAAAFQTEEAVNNGLRELLRLRKARSLYYILQAKRGIKKSTKPASVRPGGIAKGGKMQFKHLVASPIDSYHYSKTRQLGEVTSAASPAAADSMES